MKTITDSLQIIYLTDIREKVAKRHKQYKMMFLVPAWAILWLAVGSGFVLYF